MDRWSLGLFIYDPPFFGDKSPEFSVDLSVHNSESQDGRIYVNLNLEFPYQI